MSHKPVSPVEAVTHLEAQLVKMRAEPDRDQIRKLPGHENITIDEAFELGYEIAIFDLKILTQEDPTT